MKVQRPMVRPLLTYCSTVWSPGAHTENEMVPLCDQQSSVTPKLDHLEWETLESRRTKNQLVMFFKIIHGLIDIPEERFLTPASIRTRSNHSLKYRQAPPSSDYHKYSFSLIQYVSGISSQPLWLRLPVWYLSNGSSLKYHFKLPH